MASVEVNPSVSQHFYEAVLESIRDIVLVLDEQFIILYANPSAQQGLLMEGRLLPGLPIAQVLPQPDFLTFLQETPLGDAHRLYIQHGDSTYQPRISPLQGLDQHGWVMILSDVTHFKRQAENMTLFLQTVSHDLRSPLTAAKGFVDMIPMVGDLNDKQKTMREKVLVSIVDMTNLVEKVLDAGRLDPDMGAYQLRREPADPAAIIEKVVSHLTPTAHKRNLNLEKEIAPDLPVLNIDEMMLERALVNLVENAIKYTPEAGSILVRAYLDSGALILSVIDNGLGIPPEKQATIFDKGSRVRRDEHRQVRGSGLGLFIVRNVAQQHGGDALLYSMEGEGSEFQIIIPLLGPNLIKP
jgi:signal transduction histidine kinase